MTEADYNKAAKIINEMQEIKTQIDELPRCIVNYDEYKRSNGRFAYVKRYLGRKSRFFVESTKCICELSEEDLRALVDIRKNKLIELEKELMAIGGGADA